MLVRLARVPSCKRIESQGGNADTVHPFRTGLFYHRILITTGEAQMAMQVFYDKMWIATPRKGSCHRATEVRGPYAYTEFRKESGVDACGRLI